MKEVKKPWGGEKHFIFNKKCTVKILEIKPKQMFSLQKHKKRREEWYFLTPAIIQLGKQRKKVKEGDIIKIKKKQPHRIIAGNKKVQVLEISFGKFKEKDITRLEDKYGRA